MNNNISSAERIAGLIIDKVFWGNEWYSLFILLIAAILAVIGAFIGSYFATRGQNLAIRSGFKRALENLSKQTKTIKKIEEEISHNYLENREIIKIKREKIEEIYESLSVEKYNYSLFLSFVLTKKELPDIDISSNKVKMIISLYFNNYLEKELEEYAEQKKELTEKISEIYQQKDKSESDECDFSSAIKEIRELMKSYNNAKEKIEGALVIKMEELISINKLKA